MKKCLSILFIIITILGLVYTNDLQQKNKETLFLTEEGLSQYRFYEDNFNNKSIIVIKKEYNSPIDTNKTSTFMSYVESLKLICFEDCEITTYKSLPEKYLNFFKLKSDNHLGIIISTTKSETLKKIIELISSNNDFGVLTKDLHITGIPYTNYLLDQYSKEIKEKIFPILFITLFLFLLLLIKNFRLAVILYLPCLMSASLSLVAIKLIYEHSNLISSIVPILMFIINFSLVFHLFYTTKETKCFQKALLRKLKPTILMILTTFIGFSSLYLSKLQSIKDFGVLTALLILTTSLLTVLWLFINKQIIDDNIKKTRVIDIKRILPSRFFSLPTIIIITLFSLSSGFFSLIEIPILTDATKYFPKDSHIKESIENVSSTVLGTPILDILIKTKSEMDIMTLNQISELEIKIKDELGQSFPKIQVFAMNELIKQANSIYSGTDEIPKHYMSYLTLRSQIPKNLKDIFPLENYYRITLLSPPLGADHYSSLLGKISNILNEGHLSYKYYGLYYNLMTAQKEMIYTLFKSFLTSLVVIALFAFITFKKTKVFFIFLFVNIIPVFLSFVFLKLFNMSLNIATVMTYSISLGLIVDSSFHIIHTLESPHLTRNYFNKTVVLPILISNLILAFTFLMFFINSFLPIREFGVLLGIIILIGLIFDLKILPTLYIGKTSL